MKRILLALAVLPLLGSLVPAQDGATPRSQPARFKITTKRPDDRVDIEVDKDRAVFTVQSPFGISQAVIERALEKWPAVVVLRLRLKGLESFRASNGRATLHAAVSIREGKATVRWWKDGKEDALLDRTSPFWTDLRILSSDGRPASVLPPQDGYFELALPRAFFEGDPQAITLDWIDFHRR